MSVEISLSGVADLLDELERMSANSAKIQDEILQAAAKPVLTDAEQTTAFIDRSGNLRESLSMSKPKARKRGGKYILVRAKAPHAHLVEFGTSRAAAHPFLQPALEKNKQEVTEIIKTKLREALGT
ncbi:HK97 gp10 family phage protein [Paradesulfitobacterium aromaticivorans]